jgi:hypothetical protein
MRASPAYWMMATLFLLSAAGCTSGGRPNFWPFNKGTTQYSNWSKTPPEAGTQHADSRDSLSQTQGAAPPYAGQTTSAGATDPNGYAPVHYDAPVGTAGAAPNTQGYAGTVPANGGGYGSRDLRGPAVSNNPYASGGGVAHGDQYDQAADRRYGNSAAVGGNGAGYDTGSPYDTPSNPVGERYASPGDRYSTQSDERFATPTGRYNQPPTGAGSNDNANGAPGGTGNLADPAWQPGKSDYVPGGTDYNPPGVKPYKSPADPYRSNPSAPGASSWRPGGTTDYRATNSNASTRTAWDGGDSSTRPANYVSPRNPADTAAPTGGDGYDDPAVGDRYSRPAANTAGGYDANGAVRR